MKTKLLLLLFLFGIFCQLNAQHGTVKSFTKISQTQGNFPITLQTGDQLGFSTTCIGDLNNDGVQDVAIGAFDGQSNGVVYLTYLNSNGSVKSVTTIKKGQSGLPANLTYTMTDFAWSVDTIGDLDNDGVIDLVVGNPYISHGSDKGFVFILFLNSDGTVKSYKVLGEGLNGFSDNLTNTNFGYSVAGIGDINNDGIYDIAVGGPKKDYDKGAVWLLFLNSDGSVKSHSRIDITNSFISNYLSQSTEQWLSLGISISGLGDLDKDGTNDILIGCRDYCTSKGYGSAIILFMDNIGNIKGLKSFQQGISGFTDTLLNYWDTLNPMIHTGYGKGVCAIGDINGDKIVDIAISAPQFSDSNCTKCGAVGIFMLDSLGNIIDYQRISKSLGNFTANIEHDDFFGASITGIGDFNGDNIVDLIVSAPRDDDGSSNKGAVYILNLNGVPDTSPVNELEKETTVSVFPNPTSKKINIDLGKTYKSVDITVRNTIGQVYLTKSFKTTNLLSFDIKGATGVYFVEIGTTEGKLAILKVIKE